MSRLGNMGYASLSGEDVTGRLDALTGICKGSEVQDSAGFGRNDGDYPFTLSPCRA